MYVRFSHLSLLTFFRDFSLVLGLVTADLGPTFPHASCLMDTSHRL